MDKRIISKREWSSIVDAVVNPLAKEIGIKQSVFQGLIDDLFKEIEDTLTSGCSVALSKTGTLKVSHVNAKETYITGLKDKLTGERRIAPAKNEHNVARFEMSKMLKDKMFTETEGNSFK